MRNSPARTIFAAGSALLIPSLNTRSSAAYCFAFGLRNQKVGELTSFHSCQLTIGSLGIPGFADQKVPLLPYRSAAACTNARKSPKRSSEGG